MRGLLRWRAQGATPRRDPSGVRRSRTHDIFPGIGVAPSGGRTRCAHGCAERQAIIGRARHRRLNGSAAVGLELAGNVGRVVAFASNAHTSGTRHNHISSCEASGCCENGGSKKTTLFNRLVKHDDNTQRQREPFRHSSKQRTDNTACMNPTWSRQ